MENPKVLAIIPAYNSEDHIEKTVVSLLKQDYPALTTVVIDDCSRDNTFKVLQKYAEKIRIIHNKENKGLAWGLNHALSLVKDEELFFIIEDDVDLVNTDYISRGVRHFKDSRVAIVSGQPVDFDAQRLPLLNRIYARYLNYDFQSNGVVDMDYSYIKADLIRTSALREIGGFGFAGNPKLGAEDQILANNMRSKKYRILKDASLHYHLSFARMRGLSGYLKSERNAGKTLGVAVTQNLIDFTPHESRESRVKSLFRRSQVLFFGLYCLALLSMIFSLPAGLLGLCGLVLLRFLICLSRSHGFGWLSKPYFVIVGWLDDLNFSLAFLRGSLSGILNRYQK